MPVLLGGGLIEWKVPSFGEPLNSASMDLSFRGQVRFSADDNDGNSLHNNEAQSVLLREYEEERASEYLQLKRLLFDISAAEYDQPHEDLLPGSD